MVLMYQPRKSVLQRQKHLKQQSERKWTVSYTHLDVYKRQEQVIKQPFQLIKVSDNGDDTEVGLLAGAEFTAYLKSSLPVKADGSYDSVSYTHLDVYKRQGQQVSRTGYWKV